MTIFEKFMVVTNALIASGVWITVLLVVLEKGT